MKTANYSKLAFIYDKVMAHVNYKMWAQYVKNIIILYKIKNGSLLDISCGTGKFLKYFPKRKYSLFGSDISLQMLRNTLSESNVSYVQSDARFPPFKNNTFSAVFMLYDSINYLLSDDDVIKTLNRIYELSKSGALFIFDFVTREAVIDYFDDYYESNTWDGLSYERHSWFNAVENLQYNEFTMLYNGESFHEQHIQKIRSLRQWQELIEISLFSSEAVFGDFTFLPPAKKNERIHCVCRKK